MRVIVTGARGTVGTAVVAALHEAGLTVFPCSRLGEANGFYRLDLDTGEGMDSLPVADFVVHCAARLPTGKDADGAIIWDVNHVGTQRMLEWARHTSVSKFVHISSHAVYGDYRGTIDENHPVGGQPGSYGESKLMAETCVLDHATDASVSILRLPTVYGDRVPASGVVGAFLQAALRGEACEVHSHPDSGFDFVCAKDVAQGVARCLAYRGAERIFNIGSGISTTLTELAYAVVRACAQGSVRTHITSGPPIVKCLDIGRARSELEYEPRFDVHAGMRALVSGLSASP